MIGFDGDALARELGRLEGAFPGVVRQLLARATVEALRSAKATRSFNDRTRKLRGSMHRGERARFDHFIQAGGSDAPYGKFVEEGTSRMRARLFMRDARAVGEQALGGFVTDGVGRFFG